MTGDSAVPVVTATSGSSPSSPFLGRRTASSGRRVSVHGATFATTTRRKLPISITTGTAGSEGALSRTNSPRASVSVLVTAPTARF